MFDKIKSFVKSKVTSTKTIVTMALMSLITTIACLSASAEGEPDVSSAVSSATSVMSSVFSLITSNPFLLVFVGMAIAAAGLRLFKRAGKASKI